MVIHVRTPATMWTSCTFPASILSIVIFLLLLPEDFCTEIIGGNEVNPHSRPYMVLLKRGEDICGGVLIARNWVLTAAHCPRNSQVILGAHSIIKNEPEKQKISVKKEIPYPCYDDKAHEGDLKLLQLKEEAKLNENVDVLPLPKRGDDVRPGTKCQVAGWGMVNNNVRQRSDTLREVNITVIDRKICNDGKHYNYSPVIGLNMICAGSLHGGKDICGGDSGSPLICDNILRGIASFGMKGRCGFPQGPSIYTSLSKKHLSWIIKTMKGTA